MGSSWTTRCCSAFALIGLFTTTAAAQKKVEKKLGLFPPDLAWDLPLNSVLDATPALKNDRGFFPIADQIVSYDIRHGTLLWVAPAHPLFEPTLGDTLLFEVEPDAIVALHQDTGAEAWRVALKEPLAAALSCQNGWLIATTASGTAIAFRASDGGRLWQRELGALIHAAATGAEDRVYVPLLDGRIVALQLETGEPVWERRLGGTPNEIQATADRVYAGSTDNYFYALRAHDGVIDWRWPTGADVIGRPIVDEHRVYFVSQDNILRALDKNTGNQRWKRPLPIRPTRGLVVMDEMLIVSGVAPAAAAFSIKDGSPVGSLGGPGDLAAAPHVITGDGLPMLLLVSRDLAKGTILRAITRVIEPQVVAIAPLPNPTPPPLPPRDVEADENAKTSDRP